MLDEKNSIVIHLGSVFFYVKLIFYHFRNFFELKKKQE